MVVIQTLLAILGVMVSLSNHNTKPAYIDTTRIVAMPEMQSYFRAYDREIAALKATQTVPQLTDTRPVAEHQAQVALNGARDANAALDALRTRAANYSPRIPDAANIRSRIADNYDTQAATVQSKAGESAQQYRTELDREANKELASYGASLDSRVNTAYAARAQQLRENESALQIKLMRADAGQDLQLRVKLQNLKSPQVDKAPLRARLNALHAHESAALAVVQAQDARTLAAYRAQLVAQASHDYVTMSSELQRRAQANWALRQRVSQAQMQAPQHLSLGSLQGVSFNDQWAQFHADATTTGAAFTNGANDIARRFSVIGDMDNQARGSAANEIIALQRYRAALGEELAREARAIGSDIAKQRGLTLVDQRQPGAIDITPQVAQRLSQLVGGSSTEVK